MECEFTIGDQLYVNNKWYMDVIDITDESISLQIKYSESTNNYIYYKTIKLPINIFSNCEKKDVITYCKANEIELKRTIGSLINRLVKEKDILRILENSLIENGMGAVANPGLSGVPGVPGAAGSGDISGGVSPSSISVANSFVKLKKKKNNKKKKQQSVLPKNTFGLDFDRETNKKSRDTIKKLSDLGKKMKPLIKSPILLNNENIDVEIDTDSKYKKDVFEFLDYPVDNDIDNDLIQSINRERNKFIKLSAELVKHYLTKFYKLNKTLIKFEASDWFNNEILKLIDETEIK